MATFTQDVEEIRRRATRKIEDGAVTDSYALDKDRSVEILNEALATEIVCVLRYTHHYFMATGVHGRGVADLFKEHADEEREHADLIAERIQQLGGKPNFNPGDLVQRSVSQYIEGESLADMIREDLIAERMVIDVYQRMIEHFGAKDPTTRVMLEHLKADEEEHASELSDMMFIVNPQTGEDEGEDPGTDPLHVSKGGQRASGRNAESSKRRPGRDSEQEDELEEVTTEPAAAWGNEANVGKAGRGKPARSTAPEETRWGNELHAGHSAAKKKPTGTKRGETTMSKNTNITNRKDERVTPRAARGDSGREQGGRTMNRRRNESAGIDVNDVAEHANSGATSGRNKSPRVLQKNRKSKRAA